jgi:hypothetical protein
MQAPPRLGQVHGATRAMVGTSASTVTRWRAISSAPERRRAGRAAPRSWRQPQRQVHADGQAKSREVRQRREKALLAGAQRVHPGAHLLHVRMERLRCVSKFAPCCGRWCPPVYCTSATSPSFGASGRGSPRPCATRGVPAQRPGASAQQLGLRERSGRRQRAQPRRQARPRSEVVIPVPHGQLVAQAREALGPLTQPAHDRRAAPGVLPLVHDSCPSTAGWSVTAAPAAQMTWKATMSAAGWAGATATRSPRMQAEARRCAASASTARAAARSA